MKKKLLLVAIAVLGLCAVSVAVLKPGWLGPLGLGEERAVRKRAEGYWNARVAGDLKAIAPYVHPLQKSIQENNVLLTDSFEIAGVTVNGDHATVAVKAKHRVKLARVANVDREMEHEDRWVRYKGEWYHELHPTSFGEILQQGLGKWKPPVDPNPEGGKSK